MDRIDPVALAIDWLDLYKQKNAPAIAAMYAVDATISLSVRVAPGRIAIADHWRREFDRVPHIIRELVEIYPGNDSVVLICDDEDGRRISDFLRFDADGLIVTSACHVIPKRQQEPDRLGHPGHPLPGSETSPIRQAVLRCEARQTLYEARRLPVGAMRNDLRQRAVALKALSRTVTVRHCDYAIG